MLRKQNSIGLLGQLAKSSVLKIPHPVTNLPSNIDVLNVTGTYITKGAYKLVRLLCILLSLYPSHLET